MTRLKSDMRYTHSYCFKSWIIRRGTLPPLGARGCRREPTKLLRPSSFIGSRPVDCTHSTFAVNWYLYQCMKPFHAARYYEPRLLEFKSFVEQIVRCRNCPYTNLIDAGRTRSVGLSVTDSTRMLLRPMEITCLISGIGSLSCGSFIVCNSHPKMSTNLKIRAT